MPEPRPLSLLATGRLGGYSPTHPGFQAARPSEYGEYEPKSRYSYESDGEDTGVA